MGGQCDSLSGRAAVIQAAMLNRNLDRPLRPDALPAQMVAPHGGRLRWLVDTDAAARLEDR